jgi:hypothetical protein
MMLLPPWWKPLLDGAKSKALRWGKSNSFIRREDFRR